MGSSNYIDVLPIKIDFYVSETVKRFVYVHAIIGQRIYLVDAGVAGTLDQIGEALRQIGRSLDEVEAIMLTHTHPDHIGNLAQIKQVFPGCKVYAPAKESAWIENIDIQYEQRPIPNFYALAGSSVQPDVLVAAGDTVCFEENIRIEVIDFAGHSHGSVGYYWTDKQVLFSGDAIPISDEALIFSCLNDSLDSIERISKLDVI